MSDDNQMGNQVPQGTPAPGGFDWLIEAHNETAGSTPTQDAAEAPAPPTLTFPSVPPVAPPTGAAPAFASSPVSPPAYAGLPAPAHPGSAQSAPAPAAPPPSYPPAPPVSSAPPVPTAQQPVAPPTASSPPYASVPQAPASAPQPQTPAAPGLSGFGELFATPLDVAPSSGPSALRAGPQALSLERHERDSRPTTGPLDWVALVLAIILPPIGLLTAIAAVILGGRNRGFASGVAKAAIGVGAALTVVVIIAGVVGNNLAAQQAKHDAIAASSVAFCTKLKSDPATLSSSTFGWPSPGNTIPDTVAGMQTYENKWTAIEKIAPSGILSGTTKIATAAEGIISSVKATQVFNDANDIGTMQQAVSDSGIQSWVSEYCS